MVQQRQQQHIHIQVGAENIILNFRIEGARISCQTFSRDISDQPGWDSKKCWPAEKCRISRR